MALAFLVSHCLTMVTSPLISNNFVSIRIEVDLRDSLEHDEGNKCANYYSTYSNENPFCILLTQISVLWRCIYQRKLWNGREREECPWVSRPSQDDNVSRCIKVIKYRGTTWQHVGSQWLSWSHPYSVHMLGHIHLATKVYISTHRVTCLNYPPTQQNNSITFL